MRHIIAFSGGFDSTHLLLDMITHKKRYNISDDDSIVVATVNHANCGLEKGIRERDARGLILYKIHKKYPDIKIERMAINVGVNTNFKGNNGLSQPMFWVFNIIPFVNKGDCIYFGYIKNDSASSFVESVRKIVNGCSELQLMFSKDKISVEFPMLGVSKPEIIKSLYYYDPEFLEMCNSCESFDVTHTYTNDHCGKCHPCEVLRSALVSLSTDKDEKLRNWIKEKLLDWFDVKVNIEYQNQSPEGDIEVLDDRDKEKDASKYFEGTENVDDK